VSNPTTYVFAGAEVDTARRLVLRDGAPVVLQKKPFDILTYLIEHRDRAVAKDELLESIWPGEFVSESSLAVCIAKIRKALGEGSAAARSITTLHGFGYRFVGEIEVASTRTAGSVAVAAANATGARIHTAPEPVILGRKPETTKLHAAWQQARLGERRTVLVRGEGGIGKTTLIESFLAEVVADGADVWILRGDCLDLRGRCEPYLPWLDAWGQACRGADRDVVVDVLRRCAPTWLLQLYGVVSPEERAQLQVEARKTMPEQLLRMIGNATNELAALRPTIVVIEDLHWADPSSLDVLARTARDRQPAALLVLGTYRPDTSAASQRPLANLLLDLERNPVAAEIVLGRFDEETVRELVMRITGAAEPAPRLSAELFSRTLGHPLFLHAALRHLADGGRLDTVPPTLRRMIEVEVDALDGSARRLVEAGGAVGAEFAAALVAAALEAPLADIEESLLDVARGGKVIETAGEAIWPDGTVSRNFRFIHPYYAEVVGDRAARTRQREWHQRIASRLQAAHDKMLPGSIALRIAQHFELAGDLAATVVAYEDVVRVAQEEWSHEHIVAAATAAIALLADLPADTERDQRELALRMALGSALLVTRGYVTPELQQNSERSMVLARSLGAVGPQFLTLVTLSAIHQTRGETAAARARAEELVSLAEQGMPAPFDKLALGRLGQIVASDGEFERAREYLEMALDAVGSDDDAGGLSATMWIDPCVALSGYLANVLLILGYPRRAQHALDVAIDRARRIHHPLSEASAHLLATCTHALARNDDAIFESGTRFTEIGVAEGLMGVVDDGLLASAARMMRHRDPDSIDRFSARVREHERRGVLFAMPLLHCMRAEALAHAGRIEEGLAAVDAAAARVANGGERAFAADIHRLRAVLLAQQPSENTLNEAESELRTALEIARSQKARWFELRATVAWARLQQQRGRGQEARAMLDDICRWFDDGSTLPDLGEAIALQRELAAAPTRRGGSRQRKRRA